MIYNYSNKLFGDNIKIVIYDVETEIAELIASDAYNEALRLQKIFNFFDKNSELSKLNRKRELKCSPELLKIINKALEFSELTKGSYDISLGSLFLERKNGFSEKIPKCSYKDIKIIDDKVFLLHNDVIIDLGSIAKGYIVDKIVEFLKDNGVESGMVDGRGDIRFFGDKEHLVEIQHPRLKNESIKSIKLKNKAVATSGDYKQFKGDFNNSHIINNNFASVTIIADDLETADLLATVISVSDKNIVVGDNIKIITIDKSMKVIV